MKRWLTALLALAVLGAVTIWGVLRGYGQVAPPIRVGLLHSRTGAMKISEESMIDAEVLALLEKEKVSQFPPGTKWAYSNSGYVVLGSRSEDVV